MITAKEAIEISTKKEFRNNIIEDIDRKIRKAAETGGRVAYICINSSHSNKPSYGLTTSEIDFIIEKGFDIKTPLHGIILTRDGTKYNYIISW